MSKQAQLHAHDPYHKGRKIIEIILNKKSPKKKLEPIELKKHGRFL